MCNCKKQPRVETPYPTPEPIPVPELPTMIITERPTTQQELNQMDDWYNNIDEIEPIKTQDNG